MDVDKLKVAELRTELESRGLDTKGTKPILVKVRFLLFLHKPVVDHFIHFLKTRGKAIFAIKSVSSCLWTLLLINLPTEVLFECNFAALKWEYILLCRLGILCACVAKKEQTFSGSLKNDT